HALLLVHHSLLLLLLVHYSLLLLLLMHCRTPAACTATHLQPAVAVAAAAHALLLVHYSVLLLLLLMHYSLSMSL
ncbi:hypothetical protein, partial [Bosea sp. (in: a-proteobacteria)]|uniref:hypothetical protein n=1 Tax=Bosea sp. (in: a-proteobacteria) TaxID=1871050 RepID=UPI0040339C18